MISNGIAFCSYDHIGHCLILDSFKSSENNGYLMVVLSSAVLFVQLLLLLQLRVSRQAAGLSQVLYGLVAVELSSARASVAYLICKATRRATEPQMDALPHGGRCKKRRQKEEPCSMVGNAIQCFVAASLLSVFSLFFF